LEKDFRPVCFESVLAIEIFGMIENCRREHGLRRPMVWTLEIRSCDRSVSVIALREGI
jgi:hypothetical protein